MTTTDAKFPHPAGGKRCHGAMFELVLRLHSPDCAQAIAGLLGNDRLEKEIVPYKLPCQSPLNGLIW